MTDKRVRIIKRTEHPEEFNPDSKLVEKRLLTDEEIYRIAKSIGCQGLVSKNTYFAIIQIGRAIDKAQLTKDEARFEKERELIRKTVEDELRAKIALPPIILEETFNARVAEEIKIIALQSIADEPEYPQSMPDELWHKLDGNRGNTEKAMRSTVRLTKNGITERFMEALGTPSGDIKEG